MHNLQGNDNSVKTRLWDVLLFVVGNNTPKIIKSVYCTGFCPYCWVTMTGGNWSYVSKLLNDNCDDREATKSQHVIQLTLVLRKNSPHTVCENTWCIVLVGIRPSSFVHSTSVPSTGNSENTYTTFPYDLRPDSKEYTLLHYWCRCHLKLVYTKCDWIQAGWWAQYLAGTGTSAVFRLSVDTYQGSKGRPILCQD